MVSPTQRAGRWLLMELQDPSEMTREGKLTTVADGRFTHAEVGMGLRWLRNRGWAEKIATGPSHLRGAWRLTDAGLVELNKHLVRVAAYEVAQYRSSSGEQPPPPHHPT